MFSFEKDEDARAMLIMCTNIETRLLYLTTEKKLFHSIIRWLFDDTLGSIDQVFTNLKNFLVLYNNRLGKIYRPDMMVKEFLFLLKKKFLLIGIIDYTPFRLYKIIVCF